MVYYKGTRLQNLLHRLTSETIGDPLFDQRVAILVNTWSRVAAVYLCSMIPRYLRLFEMTKEVQDAAHSVSEMKMVLLRRTKLYSEERLIIVTDLYISVFMLIMFIRILSEFQRKMVLINNSLADYCRMCIAQEFVHSINVKSIAFG